MAKDQTTFNPHPSTLHSPLIINNSGALIRLILLSFCIIMAGCSPDNETDDADFVDQNVTYIPLAEYQKAEAVLVHTPGDEDEGHYGRNKPFDVRGMQEEHLAFIQALKNNNIKVYELTDLLKTAPIEKLQAVAQQLSSKDISQMDKEQLIHHILVTPPMKGIYFTRDQSITTPRGHVIGKMKLAHRKYEPDLIELCYEQMGRKVIYKIQGNDACLEGGDYLPFNTLSFIGEGLRTNRKAIEELLNADAIGHDTLVVVKDALGNTAQMHLDTYFNIIDSDLVTLPDARIHAQKGDDHYLAIDIYARAHGKRFYHQTTTNGSLVEFLQQRGISIIPISNEDEEHFASNYICVSPRHILAIEGLSEAFKNNMNSQGVQVEYLKLKELTEGTGCAHCMTQILSRQP